MYKVNLFIAPRYRPIKPAPLHSSYRAQGIKARARYRGKGSY